MASKLVILISLVWIYQQKVHGSISEGLETSTGVDSLLTSGASAPPVVEEFCSHVVCSQLPSSEYDNCYNHVITNCWSDDYSISEPRSDHAAGECDVYDVCVSLSVHHLRQPIEYSREDTSQSRDTNGGDDWTKEDSEEKRWGERLRPVKKWSERLTLYGKKWLKESPKRWSERLKIPSRKWSERLKLPEGAKRWSSRVILPQKKWYDEEKMAEFRNDLDNEKKWNERLRITRRQASLRVRRDAASTNGTNSQVSQQASSSDPAADTIIGKTFAKRSDNLEWSDEVKKWADRIMHYSKKWGARIRPFEKKWGGRIIPLAKKWSSRILPTGTKKDSERPFIDYDNSMASITSSAADGASVHNGRVKRWSERMYPHVLETRQTSYSATGTQRGGFINRILLRRAWPRAELLAKKLPFLWRKASLGSW